MRDWDEVRRWRREQRGRLTERRQAIPQAERRRLQSLILDLVERHFAQLTDRLIGFYWPFRGEIGLHPLISRLIERGARAALPVVVEKRRPLEFWAWRPGAPLERGVWNIPIPAKREVVRPTALFVPLLGFDEAGYRLGYGGGYYDRTLATMDPKPLTIGVGFELGRLPSIQPQPHDIPMDALVTEAGVLGVSSERPATLWDEDADATGSYASPPCFMHELDPSYVGIAPEAGDPIAGNREGEAGRRAGAAPRKTGKTDSA